MDRPPRLLISSVGSVLGQVILDMLGPDRARMAVIGTNSVAEAPANFACDRVHLVPATSDHDRHLDALERIVRIERPDLLLAARDAELETLPALLDRLPAAQRPAYPGPSAAIARIANDKLETFRFAAAHGLPFADTAESADAVAALVARRGLPLIAKPRRGFGSLGVFVVREEGEIARVHALGTHLFQEYLSPPDLAAAYGAFKVATPLFHLPVQEQLSVHALTGPDGGLVALDATRALVAGGRGRRIEPLDDPDLLALGRAWREALLPLGLTGPLCIQARRGADGTAVPYELNARFSGNIGARAALGHDELRTLLNLYLPEADRLAIPAPPPRGWVVRMPVDGFVRAENVDSLARDGVWRQHPAAATAAPAAASARRRDPIRLLMTSVGSMVGRAVLASLAGVRDRVHVVGTNSQPDAATNFDCDAVFRVPPTADPEAYLAAHAAVIRAERPDFVLPCRDAELEVLPQLFDAPAGADDPVYLGPTRAVAAIAHDKWTTFTFARERGLPFADTALSPDQIAGLLRRHGLPLIAKPRFGFASRDVFVIRREAELARVAALGTHLVQQYLDPPDLDRVYAELAVATPLFLLPEQTHLSANLVLGPSGVIDRMHIAVARSRAGVVYRMDRLDDPAFVAVATRWHAALATLGARGMLAIQARHDRTGAPVPFEINARLTGGAASRQALGMDDVRRLLNAHLPADRHLPLAEAVPAGWAVRTLRDRRVDAAAVETLARDGSWRLS